MKGNRFLPRKKRKSFFFARSCFLSLCCIMMISSFSPSFAQPPKIYISIRSISSSTPYGYALVGNTLLYYKQESNSIDFQGVFNGLYYGSTYADGGYRVAMQVNGNSPSEMDCLNGSTLDGVTFKASVEPQGELARICYSITNTTNEDVVVSLGTHADVMIGNNDRAPISRRVDTAGNTYGITMKDGNGAQLCVLFGSGLSGVTSVNDYWFGYYYLNNDAYSMVGNYSSGSNYMEENGSYDSGMGWCWKDRTIGAESTIVFSYLIGVGEVNLEPSSSFEVTPDDPDGWNDLSRPHKLVLQGDYESPAGLNGKIEYAVEDSEEWFALTEMMPSGSTFLDTLVVTFTPNREKHTIRFRTIDNVGNTTMLQPIEYLDVSFHEISGIKDFVYTSDSLFQTDLSCDLDTGYYEIKNYRNNVSAGTASFSMEGVFPYTIGRRSYNFNISPAPIEGQLLLSDDSFVYTGEPFIPEWYFSNTAYEDLVVNKDYVFEYKNNILPGYGTIEVEGKGNYTGTLSASFIIDKAVLANNLYEFTLPASDISYDAESHAATVNKVDGVGDVNITYVNIENNTTSTEAPVNVGAYDVYAEFTEGTLYYGKENTKIGSFTIYQFDDNEWIALNALGAQLQENGWHTSWNFVTGPEAVSKFEGLIIEQGHVVGVDFSNKSLTGIPTGLAAFSQLKSADLSHNNLTGNAGLLAAQLPNLTSLDLSYNQFTDLYPMISPNVTSLDISHQVIDRTIDFDLANLNVETLITQIPTIVLYDHVNQKYNTDLNFICTTSESDVFDYNDNEQWALQLAYINGQLTMPYISEQNTFYGNSGDTLKVFALDKNSNLTGSTFHLRLSFKQGDANFTGNVDILDVQSIINYMFDEYADRPFNFTAANLWEDEVINIQDAVCGVNILLEQTPIFASQTGIKSRHVETYSENSVASIYIDNGRLMLNAEKPVAAFDIAVNSVSLLDLNSELNTLGIMVSTKQDGNHVHLVGYSLSGGTIPTGEFEIASVAENGRSEIIATLSDSEANEIKWSANGITTSINCVAIENMDDYEFFTIAGQKINRQDVKVGSIYIIRSDGHVTKVMITK